MSSIRNITVTNARLREAIRGVANNTVGSSNNNTTQEVPCKLLEANILKWYIGLDKVILKINDQEVEGNINYPFINKEFLISVLPNGEMVDGDDGTYIVPDDTIAYVLQYDKKYLVLGFKQDESTKTPDIGEILLQAGDNCINITSEFINITCNAFFVNGRQL